MSATPKMRRRELLRVPTLLAAISTALVEGLLACFELALPLLGVAVLLAGLMAAFTFAESRLAPSDPGQFSTRATVRLPRRVPARALESLEQVVGSQVHRLAKPDAPPVATVAEVSVHNAPAEAPTAEIAVTDEAPTFDPERLVVKLEGVDPGVARPKWRIAQSEKA